MEKTLTPDDTTHQPMEVGDGINDYIRGTGSMLRRFRRMTIFGWLVAAMGFLSLVLGWRAETAHEILDLTLSCLAIASGIVVVHVSIQALDEYVKVVITALRRPLLPETPAGPVAELLAVLNDVDAGGWQDAFAALRRLEEIGRAAGLPAGGASRQQQMPAE